MLVAVRTAVVADMDRLRGVFRTASLSNAADRDHLLAHPESLVLSDLGVRQGRTRVAVGPDHDDVVGFASWLVKDGVIELEDLFVAPTWMRRGVGRALVLDAVAIAREKAFDGLEVTANPHARAFYERTGFIAGPVVETDFYPGQRMHRTVR